MSFWASQAHALHQPVCQRLSWPLELSTCPYHRSLLSFRKRSRSSMPSRTSSSLDLVVTMSWGLTLQICLIIALSFCCRCWRTAKSRWHGALCSAHKSCTHGHIPKSFVASIFFFRENKPSHFIWILCLYNGLFSLKNKKKKWDLLYPIYHMYSDRLAWANSRLRWDSTEPGVSSRSTLFSTHPAILIPSYMIVVGYFSITLVVHVSVGLSIRLLLIHVYFHFQMITWVNINGLSPNLVCALILWIFGLGLPLGKFHQFLMDLSAPDMHISLFLDDNKSNWQWIFTKFGICIDIVAIWFGIAKGQISSVFDSYLPFTWETTFVTCSLPCTPRLVWNLVNFRRKEGSYIFFPFRVNQFWESGQNNFEQLLPENISTPV